MLTLEAKKREGGENLAQIRMSGGIPAVFYGAKEKTTSVSLNYREFEKVLESAGESTVINLKSDSGDHDALIHEIVHDPITGRIVHADLYVIEKGKKVAVHVPIEFEGVSPAVKDLGGILVKVMHEVEVEAMPKDLPHNLVADISKLVDFDSHITAADLKLGAGVTLITKPEEIIALASLPKEEKEEESAPIDLASIEVEKKGKTEEEGDAAAAPEAGK